MKSCLLQNRSYINIQAELPEWQSSVYDWVKSNKGGDSQYYPPQMVTKLEFSDGEVTNKDNVSVQINNYKDGDKVINVCAMGDNDGNV